MQADAQLSRRAIDHSGGIHRQGVEEFVRENDAPNLLRHLARHLYRQIPPAGECLRHLAAAGTELDYSEILQRSHLAPHIANRGRDQDAEDRLQLLGRVEIAALAERIARRPVVAVFGMIERRLHVFTERDGTRLRDPLA